MDLGGGMMHMKYNLNFSYCKTKSQSKWCKCINTHTKKFKIWCKQGVFLGWKFHTKLKIAHWLGNLIWNV